MASEKVLCVLFLVLVVNSRITRVAAKPFFCQFLSMFCDDDYFDDDDDDDYEEVSSPSKSRPPIMLSLAPGGQNVTIKDDKNGIYKIEVIPSLFGPAPTAAPPPTAPTTAAPAVAATTAAPANGTNATAPA